MGKTSSLTGNPSASYIIWDDVIQRDAQQLTISHEDELGNDVDVFLGLIAEGNKIIVQDRTNSLNYQQFLVTGSINVVTNSFVEVPVNLITATGTGYTNFPNNQELIIAIFSSGIAGPQGPTGPAGTEITIGPNIDAITRFGSVTKDFFDPLTIDAVAKASIDGSGNIFFDRESFYLTSDVDDVATAGRIRLLGQTGPGSTGQYTLTLPLVNDTVATRATNEGLSNKNISNSTYDNGSLGITTLVSMYNVGVPSGNAAGDIYFRGTASRIERLGVGPSYSVLVVGENNLPVWKQRNFNKVTDGTAITGTINNSYTDGVLIPANSVNVGDIIEVRCRVRKTGTGGTLFNRLYIGVNNSLTSANLIGTSTAMANVTLTGQMVRTLVVKSATSTEVYPSTTTALNDDATNSAIAVTTYNIDWTIDQYFVASVQQSVGSDTTRSSFLQVKIFE